MKTRKQHRRKRIITHISHVVAGMGSILDIMPTPTNRYRRYDTQKRLGSFGWDQLKLQSDYQKVGGDIYRAIDSLEHKQLAGQHESNR